jgi:hypothetical protein
VTVGSGCPLPLGPLCGVVGSATGSIAGGVLSAIVDWVVTGASWLLDQIGHTLSASTSVDLNATWFASHYAVMVAIAGAVALPMLLVATIQAVYTQSPGLLTRAVLVNLPLAALLTAVAVKLVELGLGITDVFCSTISGGSGTDLTRLLTGIATALVASGGSSVPTFVVALGALVVVAGALVLWLELIVRQAAVYVAVLFLPLALASLVWPAVSHWSRRLVETLTALVLSKFVIVAVLSLAVGAIGSGTGFPAVLAGGALLLLAAFTPFTLLRLVPLIEAGAALQLEGARQRVRQALTSPPTGAASFALRQARQATMTVGTPGSGTVVEPEPPGGPTVTGGGAADGSPDVGGAGAFGAGAFDTELDVGGGVSSTGAALGVPPGPLWQGIPGTKEAVEAFLLNQEVEPDSVGGLPGVQMPLWGGNEPANRFVPGPMDDWGTDDLGDLMPTSRDDMGPVLSWPRNADERGTGIP